MMYDTSNVPSASGQPRSPKPTHAARLRALLAQPRAVPVVGAYDALTARLIERAGFEAVYVGGYALSATQLGLPDVGLLTMTEMLESVRRICGAVDVPVIADGDTGYGNHVNTDRLIRELERAGAAAVHLEDQAFPKRCGHMDGKRLDTVQAMVDKIAAAADARSDPDFVIVARTDALAVEGFDAAIERAERFHKAGADVLFVEAPVTLEQIAAIPRRLPWPNWFNASWDGKSPLPPLQQLGELDGALADAPAGDPGRRERVEHELAGDRGEDVILQRRGVELPVADPEDR